MRIPRDVSGFSVSSIFAITTMTAFGLFLVQFVSLDEIVGGAVIVAAIFALDDYGLFIRR